VIAANQHLIRIDQEDGGAAGSPEYPHQAKAVARAVVYHGQVPELPVVTLRIVQEVPRPALVGTFVAASNSGRVSKYA
jgi:hypothetical protein